MAVMSYMYRAGGSRYSWLHFWWRLKRYTARFESHNIVNGNWPDFRVQSSETISLLLLPWKSGCPYLLTVAYLCYTVTENSCKMRNFVKVKIKVSQAALPMHLVYFSTYSTADWDIFPRGTEYPPQRTIASGLQQGRWDHGHRWISLLPDIVSMAITRGGRETSRSYFLSPSSKTLAVWILEFSCFQLKPESIGYSAFDALFISSYWGFDTVGQCGHIEGLFLGWTDGQRQVLYEYQ